MIHLKFDLNQIKISKSFDFLKKNKCRSLGLNKIKLVLLVLQKFLVFFYFANLNYYK